MAYSISQPALLRTSELSPKGRVRHLISQKHKWVKKMKEINSKEENWDANSKSLKISLAVSVFSPP